MSTLYRLNPARSQFNVQAFAAGMLSFFGHSPTFAVGTFSGSILSEGDKGTDLRVELTIQADSLELLDHVSAADRVEIEGRMKREVLQTTTWSEIAFRSSEMATEIVSQGRLHLRVIGQLSLRGVTRPHSLDAELLVFDDGLRARGSSLVRVSEYGIAPVTALAGAIRLKDEVKVSFDLAAFPEGT